MPPTLDVPLKTCCLVLSDDQNLPQAAVDTVRQSEVDNAKAASKGNGWLAPITGKGFQSRTFTARQNYR